MSAGASKQQWLVKSLKPIVFSVCLLPFAWLLWRILQNQLGPDPGEEVSLDTGRWTMRFLLLSLAVTPARQISGIARLISFRRMIGLFALFYATLHLFSYLTFLLQWRWDEISTDILERPYITVGFTAYLILLAMGSTSTKAMMRRMGRNWKRLHKFVYLAAVLGILHLLWIVRADYEQVVVYGAILFLLLGYRLWNYTVKLRRSGADK